jgi:ABC-type phosphate transport system substrate-binding protein
MRALLVFFLLGLASALSLATSSAAPAVPGPAPSYRIVVNPSNPTSTVERRFLEDVFLKKIKHWPSGEAIRAVDLEPSSPVRRRFTEEVLRLQLGAVRAYWQQRIFAGRDVPPPELDTDQDIILFVMKHAGAVGYVSTSAPASGLKVVSIK